MSLLESHLEWRKYNWAKSSELLLLKSPGFIQGSEKEKHIVTHSNFLHASNGLPQFPLHFVIWKGKLNFK